MKERNEIIKTPPCTHSIPNKTTKEADVFRDQQLVQIQTGGGHSTDGGKEN